jgi:uncharacterized Zn-binding protein involved in type VI secretion
MPQIANKSITRLGVDKHVGHESITPNPFHKTSYAQGSPDTYVNGSKVVRLGDKTGCGDPAAAGSTKVRVNGIPVHRLMDATGGHGSWVPNMSSSGSNDTFAGG